MGEDGPNWVVLDHVMTFHDLFVDGNKRTGWGTARMFARRNGLELVCAPEDSYQAVLGFAAGPKGESEEELLAEFMYDHLWPRQ